MVGADAKEVERGLKSEQRIGPRAYLSPGAAFAGGTLARDIGFLLDLARQHSRSAHLFQGVRESNECQKNWLRDQLASVPTGATVAVLGLTTSRAPIRFGTPGLSSYASGCSHGVKVRAHDPAVKPGAEELRGVELAESAEAALRGADVGVLATPWPEYRMLTRRKFTAR